jgi:hypothetical protein
VNEFLAIIFDFCMIPSWLSTFIGIKLTHDLLMTLPSSYWAQWPHLCRMQLIRGMKSWWQTARTLRLCFYLERPFHVQTRSQWSCRRVQRNEGA